MNLRDSDYAINKSKFNSLEGDIVRCWPEGWPIHKDVFMDSIVNTDVMKLLKECRIKRVIGNVHEHKELLRQRAAL